MTSAEAKQFLISRIVDEARSEDVPLAEIEIKMLSFSEAHPWGPDMYDIAAQFDENYETIEYETKITRLIRSAYRLDEKGSAERSRMWRDARQALRWEDHYIKVMLRPAIKYAHRGRDLLIYVCVGIAVVFTLLLAVALKGRR